MLHVVSWKKIMKLFLFLLYEQYLYHEESLSEAGRRVSRVMVMRFVQASSRIGLETDLSIRARSRMHK